MHASPIVRRISRQIMVGNVPVGGGAPISIQSMTNTETCDVNTRNAEPLGRGIRMHAVLEGGRSVLVIR